MSVWPQGLSEKNAEKQEQIVHIHFDAKYKVNHFAIETSKGDDEEELNKIKQQERSGTYKNADLLKMHAYKDAIRRTGGAYILYPGDTETQFKGFHELIPGLGAFSLNPNNEKEDVAKLSDFIDEVIDHLINTASQRENIAAKAYDIHKAEPLENIKESIPEYIDDTKLIPDEAFVLVGYCKSQAHLDWIEGAGQYNLRMHSDRGALKLNNESLNAKYLLLHMKGDESSSRLYEISKPEYTVTSKVTLQERHYPTIPSQEYYLVVGLSKCTAKEFKGVSWNFKDLEEYQSGRASAIPFTTSLRDFLEVRQAE